ncbi:Serine/threonine-protein kinase, active site [Sesbania bispinosa]|nr:Serine/threonine-protein kinase, active site [Sesbania bispinosa]
MEGERKRLTTPRLDRRNAMKNIDYQVEVEDDEVMNVYSSSSASLLNKTSFRVKGIDGEFDHIFRSLGFSGPEDFAIPTSAWEQSQKARFSSPIPNKFNPKLELQTEKDMNNVSSENRDGGIKGVRPPVLRAIVAADELVTPPLEEEERDVLICDCSDDDVGEKAFSDRDMVEEYSNSMDDVSPSSSISYGYDGSFRQIFGSWQKGDILGKGSFGTVYEGFTHDGIFFAVKEVSLLDDGSQGKQSIFQLQQEICLLSQFKHDNIVRYIGTDKDDDKLYIFLELVTKGSLASLYQKYRLKDSQVSVYTRQILSGLKYLHDRNVVHRDIKCANILVDANGSVKLADFGLAKATKLNDVKSSKGSPYWMAPEVVNLRNRGYGLAADIWSLGCPVLEMLTRQPPYSHLEGMQALFRIGNGQPPPVSESLSKDARDFILKCLQVNPNKRPTAAQLLDHPFEKVNTFADSYYLLELDLQTKAGLVIITLVHHAGP